MEIHQKSMVPVTTKHNGHKAHIYEQSLRCALLAHTCRTRTAGTERRAESVLLMGTWPAPGPSWPSWPQGPMAERV